MPSETDCLILELVFAMLEGNVLMELQICQAVEVCVYTDSE